MIATEKVVPKKRLRIKFATKRIEAELQPGSNEFGLEFSIIDGWSHSNSVNGSEKLENKRYNCVAHSSKVKNKSIVENAKTKPSLASSNKRGPPGGIEGQKEKRQRMDRSVKLQCSCILKKLMNHPAGWIFNQPVDPVELNIPDYFSIISEPMDLGTIKSKLDKNIYFSTEEFAADVRLTFSNAMLYNPPTNHVHTVAKELNNIFNMRWKSVDAKTNCESSKVEQGQFSSGRAEKNCDLRQNCHQTAPSRNDLLSNKSMSSEEKQKLRKELVELSRGKMPPQLRSSLQRFGLLFKNGERSDVDIAAFDENNLWELKKVMRTYSDAGAAEVELPNTTRNCGPKSLGKNIRKVTDHDNTRACGPVDKKLPLSLLTCKQGSCGGGTCQCSLQCDSTHASSSDLSSEISVGKDHHALCGDATRPDDHEKNIFVSQISKSDPDSDGSVSALDEENSCPSSQLSVPVTDAASVEGWTPLFDVQLSPKKALRAAMLKSRFADTILKAQQKTLLDHGDKADPVRMQQEKERLERKQREEKARIEAQIRAAKAASQLKAETELKMHREREREAARIALAKMEKTVVIDESLEILKDLEMLCGCSLSVRLFGGEGRPKVIFGALEHGNFVNPLERLGLFMKDDYLGDEDEEALNEGGEEGEIFS